MINNTNDYTRLLSRERGYGGHSKPTNCECDYCGEKLLQIGLGYEEGKNEVPLYRCAECKYYEIIVNDNRNAVIKKVIKNY